MSAVGRIATSGPAAVICASNGLRIGRACLIGEHGRERMSEAAIGEVRKPEEGPLHAFANAMSGGVLLVLDGRVYWASERLAEMAGFESSSDLAELPLVNLFSDTGDGLPGLTTPGHLMRNGSRIPPSYSQPFPPRSGRLDVGEPSDVESPPLSAMKQTTVLSSRPKSFSFANTRPTLTSIVSTMAA